jgi:hypothetical protein
MDQTHAAQRAIRTTFKALAARSDGVVVERIRMPQSASALVGEGAEVTGP